MTAAPSQSNNSTTGRKQIIPLWLKSGLHVADLVAPSVADKWLRKMYFSPSRLRISEKERAILSQGTRFSLEVDGVDVVAHAWGSTGPTVWLVHGWAGHLGQLTSMVNPLLQAGYRVVGFDWPAHGESGGTVSSLLHARRTFTKLRGMLGSPFGVIAHSFGAAATTLALVDGLEAQRIVFISPAAQLQPYIDRFSSMMGMNHSQKARFVKLSEQWLEAPFADFEPLNFARDLKVPLLVIHSRDDREVDFEEAQQLTSVWSGSQLKSIDGLGHRRILKDVDTIRDAVEFLQK